MIGMQYNSNSLQGKSVVEVSRFGSAISSSLVPPDAAKFKKNGGFASSEPVSVLDTRSPSPSTSTSASSSSHGGGGGYKTASLVAPPIATTTQTMEAKEKCVGELHPAPEWSEGPEKFDLGMEDWECLLAESGGSDQYLLRWISGDVEDPSLSLKQLLQGGNNPSEIGFGASDSDNYNGNSQGPNVNFPHSNLAILGSGLSVQELQYEQKPQTFNSPVLTELQNVVMSPNVFSSPLYGIHQEQQPPSKRQNSGSRVSEGVFLNPSNGFLDRPPDILSVQPKKEAGFGTENLQEQQAVYDYVYKAAELILNLQFSNAEMILARLNHRLSPMAKPLERAAFYFKEALHLPLTSVPSLPPRIPSPVDGVFKMGAYKVFSEVSPLIQFMNFTSNQAILEAVDGAECIHIFDFDIAFGAQWSSFMQELPRRNRRAPPWLKITAFASPSTHHPIEINLMHENLTQFANEVGVKFELEVVNFDSFDPSSYPVSSFRSSESEAIAVNFPVWSVSSHRATLPLLLHYIKQLSPKVVVSLARGYERTELPFPHHLLNALQYFEALFESIDAGNVTPDASNKIERFLFQPSIESIVFGHLRFPDQMPPWRNLFASAGFQPHPFSNFAETQAECVVKRTETRGFHVQKHHASLALCWQNRELLSATAWRC
ncbi:PREDICTED: scarecrow-like protein 6 isoform X2 [Ipomoea nil]|uniref:scarecrow-like protein 6 isoform X2 n=1 Tax=Ipomoea nil TaxID=35883 RepID=UPI000900AF55|nr:PREDICTED: scarecrow-like protein 6 isoform X2 [Ipomoea nil]